MQCISSSGGVINCLLPWLVDDSCHHHENRPKIDVLDVAANMSTDAHFRDMATTSAFSTSKIGLDDIFMMCYGLK